MNKFPFYLLLLASAASFDVRRKLDRQTKDLKNGEALTVNIVDPELNAAPYEVNTTVPVKGSASVGLEPPDVAFIYVIDSSGSTAYPDSFDHNCTTVLECIQVFFEELHDELTLRGAAELAAVIDFDDDATVALNWTDSNDGINAAFTAKVPVGDTNCEAALQEALALFNSPNNTASHTHVILATDGQCNEVYNATDVHNATQAAADDLRDAGVIVHTVSVGSFVDCKTGELATIPRNGGTCRSVNNQTELLGEVDELIGTTLESLELQVDDGNYTPITINQSFPLQGPGKVDFDMQVPSGLAAGNHTICVRATGNTTIGGFDETVDCHEITVVDAGKSGLEPYQKFFIAAAVLWIVGLAIFVAKNKSSFLRRQEDGPADLEMQVESNTGSGEGPAFA